VLLCALALGLTACASQPPGAGAAAVSSGTKGPAAKAPSSQSSSQPSSPAQSKAPSSSAPAARTPRTGGGTATLAFAGDVHFEGSSAAALSGRIGSAFGMLRGADLSVVNLETAVTDRGTPQPKEFTFRAPASAFGMLERAGVDAVSIANNHGMDYGRVGLTDTLASARAAGMPLLGAGQDDTAAWTPLRREVKGVRVSVFAATDVLDDFAQTSWPAAAGRPGLASAKGATRLLDRVKAERGQADVVVVFLHWGQERIVCPTARQQQLARQLAAAGADVVVGSHAHVVQPVGTVGKTLVHYGMGNFQFYAGGGPGANTGVMTVTVTRAGVTGSTWHPATIVGGVPMLLTGQAAAARTAANKERFASC
jgi:poly-gamma-glutamate capsule biosynthesis protein CapA/YwtB (metallophosphatase superfamily)